MRVFFLLLATLLLTGCNATNAAQKHEALQVELTSSVDQIVTWEPITFTVAVESKKTDVSDAIVEIELLNETKQSVGILQASESESGIYQLETVLDVPGTYEIIAHVTHGEDHAMPSIEIEVVD